MGHRHCASCQIEGRETTIPSHHDGGKVVIDCVGLDMVVTILMVDEQL
jgi:hypothetical protein